MGLRNVGAGEPALPGGVFIQRELRKMRGRPSAHLTPASTAAGDTLGCRPSPMGGHRLAGRTSPPSEVSTCPRPGGAPARRARQPKITARTQTRTAAPCSGRKRRSGGLAAGGTVSLSLSPRAKWDSSAHGAADACDPGPGFWFEPSPRRRTCACRESPIAKQRCKAESIPHPRMGRAVEATAQDAGFRPPRGRCSPARRGGRRRRARRPEIPPGA